MPKETPFVIRRLKAEFPPHKSDGETEMIDTAFKTHKETAFGWVWAILWLADALKARSQADRTVRILAPR
jgi:hypothetical protein